MLRIFIFLFLSIDIFATAAWAQEHTHTRATSFAAHMAEQMLLMDIVAPLCAAGWLMLARRRTPGRTSRLLRKTLFAFLRRAPVAASSVAGILHAVVMWGWHIPSLYGAASAVPALHSVMQVTFFGAGLLFWVGILGARGDRAGVALFWLFVTVMHTGLLGALLTFAQIPLYGVSLEDQRLGGTLMWVVGTAIYATAGLAVAGRWLHVLERARAFERPA